jgi:hypothetical protein
MADCPYCYASTKIRAPYPKARIYLKPLPVYSSANCIHSRFQLNWLLVRQRRVCFANEPGQASCYATVLLTHLASLRSRSPLALCRLCHPASRCKYILRLVELFGLLPSLDDGGPEARLRSASRISVEAALRSVATSCSKPERATFSTCTGRASAKPLSRPLLYRRSLLS